jgi:hypothetical protein
MSVRTPVRRIRADRRFVQVVDVSDLAPLRLDRPVKSSNAAEELQSETAHAT